MDPNINTETGETTSTRSARFPQWAAFLVFSTITLGSAVQVVRTCVRALRAFARCVLLTDAE